MPPAFRLDPGIHVLPLNHAFDIDKTIKYYEPLYRFTENRMMTTYELGIKVAAKNHIHLMIDTFCKL